MAAGVGVHTVLHLHWLAHMTRRIASGDKKRSGRVAPAGGGRKARVPATAAAAGVGGSQPGAPRDVAAGELERLERRWEDRRRESERRHTRKAFLTGAAAVGGAALLVGLGLAGRDAANGLLDRSAEQAPTDEVGWKDQAGVVRRHGVDAAPVVARRGGYCGVGAEAPQQRPCVSDGGPDEHHARRPRRPGAPQGPRTPLNVRHASVQVRG